MQILEDAQRIADKCVNPDDRAAILKATADLISMTDALCELREQGLVSGVLKRVTKITPGSGEGYHDNFPLHTTFVVPRATVPRRCPSNVSTCCPQGNSPQAVSL